MEQEIKVMGESAMNKKLWVILVCLSISIGLLLGGLASASQLEDVRLSEVVRSVFYAPHYAAIEKGFFAEEGINIILETAWGADKGAAALISGSVDIGFFGPEAALYIYQHGATDAIVGFAQLTARDGSFFMARDLNEEFRWENVKGKTIVGARKGGVPQMVLEWVLKQNGIQPFVDVNIITNLAFEAAVGAYQAGVGDYIAQFEPAMSQVEQLGGGKIVASLGEEAGPITYTVYHVRRRTLQERPDLLIGFTRAIIRGQQWVHENTAETIATVVTPYFPDIALEILAKTIERYKSINAWPLNPILSEEEFMNLQKVMIEAGELERIIPFEELMDNTIVLQALDS